MVGFLLFHGHGRWYLRSSVLGGFARGANAENFCVLDSRFRLAVRAASAAVGVCVGFGTCEQKNKKRGTGWGGRKRSSRKGTQK